MKKIKKKKNKQKRNVIVVLIMLMVLVFIFWIAPNYKREDDKQLTFILNNENLSKKIDSSIIVEDNDVVYMGINDIKKLLDENLFYNNDDKQIITTSNMHTCYIKPLEAKIELNGVSLELTNPIKEKEGTLYLPISELKTVYNIEITYIKNENTVIIENLDKEKNKANLSKNTKVKWKETIFSKTVDKLKKGESVTVIENSGNKWVKVITDNGKIGFVKQNNLTNYYNVRQSMDLNSNTSDNYYWKEVKLADNTNLDSIEYRKMWIENAIQDIITNEEDGICINFENIKNYEEKYLRLLIELAPRLREVGKKTAVKNNKIINTQKVLQIVDKIEGE